MNNYLRLVEKIDRFVGALSRRHPSSFACKPGCTDCCVAGITVWRVEFDNLRTHLKAAGGDAIESLTRRSKSSSGRCPLLDDSGRCAVYAERPVVCRLWGAPLAFSAGPEAFSVHAPGAERLLRMARNDEGSITCCDNNFRSDIALDELVFSDIINVETVLNTLAAVNHVYCKEKGLDPEERLALERSLLTFAI
ncbi:MAG: YkgJ family cysteine cluster protein [Pseudomonadota bacterium]